MNRLAIIIVLIVFVTAFSKLIAQVSKYVVNVKTATAIESMPLTVDVELSQSASIQRIILKYRSFSATEFKQTDMIISGRRATTSIPNIDVTLPYIEYYLEMHLIGDVVATFPEENPEGNPLKIFVSSIDPRDAEIKFLSPEEGEKLTVNELAIAVSLLYVSDAVNKKLTHVYLDYTDVTNEAIITDDIILYNPQSAGRLLETGLHYFKVELFDTTGNLYYAKKLSFNISTPLALMEERESFKYGLNTLAEIRHEKFGASRKTYVRGDVRFNGNYRSLSFGSDVHLTNEEKSYLQPQNRFLAFVQAEEYANLQIGDAYPSFPSLVVSGKRVRGITGYFNYTFINLDISYGQIERPVEGTVIKDTTYADSSQASARPKESYPLGGLTYRLFKSGTFSRNIFVIRPSFGNGENFQIGLTYLKSKDNTNSIIYGTFPKENLVASVDLLLAFDDQRVRWFSQVAGSIENKDISEGSYTDEDFRQFKLSTLPDDASHDDTIRALNEAEDLIKVAKVARKFITVNSNLSPLNPLKGSPSLSYESEFTLNYFNNFIRLLAFRRGVAYKSYGNDFIQNDIAGINISDRIRLFENRAIVSLSYETKHNNVQNDASLPTTKYNTFNSSISAYPGFGIPSFTIGYGFYYRKNPIDMSEHVNLGKPLIMDIDTAGKTVNDYIVIPWEKAKYIVDDFTNRFYIGSNHVFNFLGKQNVVMSFTLAQKQDRTFYKRDQNNLSALISTTTEYEIPLQTTISVVTSHNSMYYALQDSNNAYINRTQKQTFNYQTLSFGGRYRLLDDMLNLAAVIAPSFGDFRRLLIQLGVDYQIASNHYLVYELDFIRNSGGSNDLIMGITYRFNM